MKKQKKSSEKKETSSVKNTSVKVTPQALPRLMMIICSIVAFALYANTLGHQFTIDDDMVVSKNSYTKQGISALPEIFATPYRAGFHDREENLYRPLSVALFAVTYQLAGNKPFLFHLMNVLLYALTSAILFVTLRKIFAGKTLFFPFFITLLYVVHPVHTEVAANVKSADEILAFLFSLLAINLSLDYLGKKKLFHMMMAGCCYLLALLSKESAATILFIIPLVFYFFSKPNRSQWLTSSVILIIAFVLYLTLRLSVLENSIAFSSVEVINNSLVSAGDDRLTRTATAIYITGKYILMLFIPHPLCYDYSFNSIPLAGFSNPGVLISLAVIVFLGIVAVKGFKRRDPVAFGILFFAITFSIVSNLVILIESTMAERFLYMPSLGFCVAVVFFLAGIFKINFSFEPYSRINELLKHNAPFSFIFIAILLLFSIRTFSRNFNWKDNFTLLTHDVKINPNSARIRYSLGSTYIFEKALLEKNPIAKKEFLEAGIRELKKGTDLIPYYGDAWFNMGYAYKELEDYKTAVICFEKGFEHVIKPSQIQYTSAGIAFGESGNYKKAFEMFHHVLAMNDTAFDAYNNMGLYYADTGNYDSAFFYLNRAIQLQPANSKARYNLGNAYARMNDFKMAVKWYQEAIALNAANIDAYVNMGNSYAAMKEYQLAIKSYQQALSIEPGNAQANNNLGITYLILGDSISARQFLGK